MEWRQSIHPEYEVSEYGQLRSLVDRYQLLDGSYRYPAGKIMTGTSDPQGYVKYKLRDAGMAGRNAPSKTVQAHTLVLHAFVGPKPSDDHQCAHYDGNPSNNHYTNLRWATAAENAADKVRHGNHRLGNRVYEETDIIDMRARRKLGDSYADIIEVYPMSKGNLSPIINRKTWGYLDDEQQIAGRIEELKAERTAENAERLAKQWEDL
jgi:hypothetical protein